MPRPAVFSFSLSLCSRHAATQFQRCSRHMQAAVFSLPLSCGRGDVTQAVLVVAGLSISPPKASHPSLPQAQPAKPKNSEGEGFCLFSLLSVLWEGKVPSFLPPKARVPPPPRWSLKPAVPVLKKCLFLMVQVACLPVLPPSTQNTGSMPCLTIHHHHVPVRRGVRVRVRGYVYEMGRWGG